MSRRKVHKQLYIQRQHEYKKLMRFLRNRYSYEFIDEAQKIKYLDKLPFRYLEKQVAQYGRGCVYDHENYGIAIYKAVMSRSLDIYGRPNGYYLYTANGTQFLDVKADDKNLVLLQDNFNGEPLEVIAERYGVMLGKIRETIITNVFAMRTPFLIQAEKERLIDVKMALSAVNEEPEVIVDTALNFAEAVKVLKLEVPDRLKSLEDEYNTTFAKFKEEIGFSSQNVDKKERLVAREAEDDKGTLIAFDNESYEARKTFIFWMEQRLGIKLKLIKSNKDLYLTDDNESETDEEELA